MSKNQELLDSLTQFLSKHPEMRFWQGLLAWTKEHYHNKYGVIEAIWAGGEFTGKLDTFYWE